MPKDNEVDENVIAYRVRPVGWGVVGDWLLAPIEVAKLCASDDRYEVEPLYSAATVAELRARILALETELAATK